jgi:hypothetical protein
VVLVSMFVASYTTAKLLRCVDSVDKTEQRYDRRVTGFVLEAGRVHCQRSCVRYLKLPPISVCQV